MLSSVVRTVFRNIRQDKRNMKRIAIKGELGSFHDITAHQYFEGEQIEIICCATFEEGGMGKN